MIYLAVVLAELRKILSGVRVDAVPCVVVVVRTCLSQDAMLGEECWGKNPLL